MPTSRRIWLVAGRPASRWSALALGIILAASASARTFYVAPDGDDGDDGRTRETAWQTPGHAFADLEPGDTVRLADGRYPWGGQVHWRGAPGRPITVEAEHPGRAILDGGARIQGWRPAPGVRHVWVADVPEGRPVRLCSEADTGRVLEQEGQPGDCEGRLGCWAFDAAAHRLYLTTSTGLPPDRHVIEVAFEEWGLLIDGPRKTREPPVHVALGGLVFENYATAAIRANRASHLLIEDCRVLQSGYGIHLWYNDHAVVRRCEISSTYYQRDVEAAGILFHGTTTDSLAEDNYVHDSPQDGIRAYSGTSKGTLFVRNLVVGTRDPMYFKGQGELGAADGNVLVGGRWFGYVTGSLPPERGANTLVGVSTPLRPSPTDLMVKSDVGARFADPSYHDYRLQSDSPLRGGAATGAFPYEGSVLYVGPAGSDDRDGTSVEQAWRTLAHAATSLRPGQTLYLLPGTYTEPLRLTHGGSADRPVQIRAHGGGRVVLDRSASAEPGIRLSGAPYVEIEGIEVTGGSGTTTAIAIEDSPGAGLRRIAVRGAGSGIQIRSSPGGFLEHAWLSDNRGTGLELGAGSPGWTVRSTAFARNGDVQVSVAEDSRADTQLQGNVYDLRGGKGLGIWGSPSPSHDLASWQRHSGQDGSSAEAPIDLPGAERGRFDVEPGSILAGAGWLGETVGPGRLLLEAPPPTFEHLEVSYLGAYAAVISWETPRREDLTLAWYGKDGSLDQKIVGAPGTLHRVTLADLAPDTTYTVRVGGEWRHSTLPAPVPRSRQGMRDFSELAGPLARLEARGETTGISPPLQLHTLTTPPPGRRLYVSTHGDDDADGLGAETAWRTLRRASQQARPGDEVLIEPGVYEEALAPASGGATAERRIVYRSAGWQPVVVSGSDRIRKWALWLEGHRHMTFDGFRFVGQGNFNYGQVMLGGMTDDLVFRHCFFDGRGGESGGIRTTLNSTNDATVEDSAFLFEWLDIVWFYGSLRLHHVVFDVGRFGHVQLMRNGARLSVTDSVATSASPPKTRRHGHLIQAESTDGIQSDYNRFYFQPYDHEHHLFLWGRWPRKVGAHEYAGAEGLESWRRDTGNDRNSRIIQVPDFAHPFALDERGRPDPTTQPLWLDAYRLAPTSPLRGAASDGADIGIRFPEASPRLGKSGS
jgi:Right handed beta helix region